MFDRDITKLPTAVPTPIMFGRDFPVIKMTHRDGRQVFESKTNQNLFLNNDSFDSTGTYPMSNLLFSCAECERFGEDCPLVMDGWYDDRVVVRDECDWTACPGFERLASYCDSEAQRLFFEHYCRTMCETTRNVHLPYFVERYKVPTQSIPTFVKCIWCRFPALIPEVWLNYMGRYDDRTQEEIRHLQENPQRVDFVMLTDGRKLIIEIDGPSHYATYNESTASYSVDESRYTKNLRIERSLRRQGWEFFRYSNQEVREAVLNGEFAELIRDLPTNLSLSETDLDELDFYLSIE